MIDEIKDDALVHAHAEYPRESCGLAVVVKGRLRYVPCRNLSASDDNFELSPEDYADAEDKGEIVAVIHSHPDQSCNPSQADVVNCEKSGLPWHIVGLPSEQWAMLEPTGYKAPLVGRVFSHGTLDCYSLVRDYYLEILGITLPDFPRFDKWWDKEFMKGEPLNLYVDNFAKAGFVAVDRPPKLHDVILMQVKSDIVNHAAVYLGDEVVLQHFHGRLSSRDVYGGAWLKITRYVLEYRHG